MANDHLQSTVEGAMNTIKTNGDDQGLNMFPSIDFTSITHDGESAHYKKEIEIYKTMQTMPGRNINLVDQKTTEQIEIEKELELRKTYERLSLPMVIKSRHRIKMNPHTKV